MPREYVNIGNAIFQDLVTLLKSGNGSGRATMSMLSLDSAFPEQSVDMCKDGSGSGCRSSLVTGSRSTMGIVK